ncbi:MULTISPECIES: aminoacyl-tRNA hydrolase [Eubacterium]|uniref:Peptidyl-tRNA hydrolase n=1 Tax=Eubacterium ruminantium TaxID=42322 RepID=A0A1T4KQ67_9FIRM|nr:MULTISPECIES: aminoacyl-tRNA hydrolase [Eubacterium]MCR5366907.1 aminoacyl-tRNA hydrolase [Eubacterium sp.]SCW33855.1 peptidyl-tRNA hydrolase, PTH1 family [Eubacterium ruminantium]SDM31810.1 peptidyl-tRNA hydrolase [Eubacterium ruminantium]SJZ44554.1 peptidyl-tRNA hydrolase [Eubacterium ruminantium]
MKVIAGLGNPTKKYEGTRHNMGFSAIYQIADRYNIKMNILNHKALIGTGIIAGEKVMLVMPQTFMNLSGESIGEILRYYKLTPEDLIVLYDDIDLDIGKLRIRAKGSAGGHNGIKNIIAHIGTTEFDRVRIGVGHKPEGRDLADYVLSRFSSEELPVVRDSVSKAADAIEVIITTGIDAAMNKFN